MSGILAMMVGARPSPVSITNQGVFKGVTDPTDATATYVLNIDRAVRDQDGNLLEKWLDASYTPGDFEVRATVSSGTTPTGNIGTWNNLGTTRSWSEVKTTVGTKTCTLLIEIGYAGLNVALDSATITITADVS